MKKRKNTEVIIRDTDYDTPLLDFTVELLQTQRNIKKYKAEIEFADKYNIEADSTEELFNSISDLHTVENILKGHFDILVIFERVGEKE